MKVSKKYHVTKDGHVKRNPVRHFKSDAAYKRWLATGHIHGYFKRAAGNQTVYINGRKHKVSHKE